MSRLEGGLEKGFRENSAGAEQAQSSVNKLRRRAWLGVKRGRGAAFSVHGAAAGGRARPDISMQCCNPRRDGDDKAADRKKASRVFIGRRAQAGKKLPPKRRQGVPAKSRCRYSQGLAPHHNAAPPKTYHKNLKNLASEASFPPLPFPSSSSASPSPNKSLSKLTNRDVGFTALVSIPLPFREWVSKFSLREKVPGQTLFGGKRGNAPP